jgi:predicted O-methyltransferase YrrM
VTDWAAVDRYLEDLLVPSLPAGFDPTGLPRHEVAPNQGRLLELLARAVGARAILELGTLGGYSTIWLARGLAEGGRVVTLEVSPEYARVAQANFERLGLAGSVDLHVGPALAALPTLDGPFDLISIDADKQSNPEYLGEALRLSRPGTLIVADNVVRGGAVMDPGSEDSSVQGARRFLELVAEEPRLLATALQTVGAKGHDGFMLALVTS